MSHVTAHVRICNPEDESKCMDLDLLVDTGSTYTWIKCERLEALGIASMGTRRFRAIEGRIIERQVGEAVIECMGRKATRIVVFAENNDVEVLGVEALEGLGLEVDPVTKKLKETEAILAL